jgi:hypothetical protein
MEIVERAAGLLLVVALSLWLASQAWAEFRRREESSCREAVASFLDQLELPEHRGDVAEFAAWLAALMRGYEDPLGRLLEQMDRDHPATDLDRLLRAERERSAELSQVAVSLKSFVAELSQRMSRLPLNGDPELGRIAALLAAYNVQPPQQEKNR